jgi:excisionase family DNA binding protein
MLMSVEEAARRLGVPADLVRSWCRYGILPHYKLRAKGKPDAIGMDPDELAGFIAGAMPQEAPPNPGDVLPPRALEEAREGGP